MLKNQETSFHTLVFFTLTLVSHSLFASSELRRTLYITKKYTSIEEIISQHVDDDDKSLKQCIKKTKERNQLIENWSNIPPETIIDIYLPKSNNIHVKRIPKAKKTWLTLFYGASTGHYSHKNNIYKIKTQIIRPIELNALVSIGLYSKVSLKIIGNYARQLKAKTYSNDLSLKEAALFDFDIGAGYEDINKLEYSLFIGRKRLPTYIAQRFENNDRFELINIWFNTISFKVQKELKTYNPSPNIGISATLINEELHNQLKSSNISYITNIMSTLPISNNMGVRFQIGIGKVYSINTLIFNHFTLAIQVKL